MIEQTWLTTSAGVKMPRIIYGTAWKKDRTAALVINAVQAGFNGIDTACQPNHYNELLVGDALQSLKDHGIERKDLFLQTKFTPLLSQDIRQVPYDRNSPVELQVEQSFEVSKKNLQTEYIDSFVLHYPIAPYTLLMKAWNAMEKIQKSGEARQLGISNCYNKEMLQSLCADSEVKPAILQNRFYQETGYDTGIRHWCSNHGIIYQSYWTLTANPHILSSNTIQTIAHNYNKTEAQIFFRYLSQSGIVPLTGTSSEQHMREDLSIFAFDLSPEDLEDVSLLLNQV